MNYRTLGTTQEQASILGFGCMRLPVIDRDMAKIDEEKAIPMVRYAVDQGVNYIDTAWPYHGGMSESFVGKALQNGYRKKVHLATKLPSWLIEKESDMEKYLDLQLERLQTNVIDFYLIHALKKTYWENLKAHNLFNFIESIRKKGKIKHIGFSFHDHINLFKEIADAYDWTFCQIQYNYLDENYQAGKEGLAYAARKGLGMIVMEPLKGGNLVSGLPGEVTDAFDHAETQMNPAAWGLKWLWHHPEIHVVLSGMSTMEQVKMNIHYANEAKANCLTASELNVIEKVRSIFNTQKRIPCTACEYCMPCPYGVNISKNFHSYNEYYRFKTDEAREKAKFTYNMTIRPDEKASQCTACGACEEHCPQAIEIRKDLKKVIQLFESEPE